MSQRSAREIYLKIFERYGEWSPNAPQPVPADMLREGERRRRRFLIDDEPDGRWCFFREF
jgi:hypothetical protein